MKKIPIPILVVLLAAGFLFSWALPGAAADVRRCVSTIISTVTVTVTTTTLPPSSGEPPAIAGQGYQRVFADEFTTLDRSIWDDHIWYDDPPHPDWTNFQTVHDGELDLRSGANDLYAGCTSRCYPMNTVTTMSSGRVFTYGYFEARMKWTKGAGAWPAFWLISYRHATNPSWPSVNTYCVNNGLPKAQCYSAELDVFEGQGSEPQSFYGTIHRNSCSCYGIPDSQNSNNWQPAGSDLTAGFHTYAMLWTASQITWYLDDVQLMSAPVYDSTNQPMFLLLQMWSGGWTLDPDATTPTQLHTEVDWIHVWQK